MKMLTTELTDIYEKIEGLKHSEVYKTMYDCISKNKIDGVDCSLWSYRQPRNFIEDYILKRGFSEFFSFDTVKHSDKRGLLTLLITAYYGHCKKKIELEDGKKIFNIYERIIAFGADFDRIIDPPKPRVEFYKKMVKVRWTCESKKIKKRILKKRTQETIDPIGDKIHRVWSREYGLDYMTAAIAVNAKRNYITADDVIKTWNIYLKTIYQDITRIAQPLDRYDQKSLEIFENAARTNKVKKTDIIMVMREQGLIE